MIEKFKNNSNPEQDLFGDSYSLNSGINGNIKVRAFYKDRISNIRDGLTTWLPRNLYDDNGICADLYKESRIIATLVHEFASNLSSVYVTSENGKFGDTIHCELVSIDEAVTRANIFAADQ